MPNPNPNPNPNFPLKIQPKRTHEMLMAVSEDVKMEEQVTPAFEVPSFTQFFEPNDPTLIEILVGKLLGKQLTYNIEEFDKVYSYHPNTLPLKRHMTDKGSPYYFALTKTVDLTSTKQLRTLYWKAAAGEPEPLVDECVEKAFKRTLEYYEGIANGKKTEWIMHQYYLNRECIRDTVELYYIKTTANPENIPVVSKSEEEVYATRAEAYTLCKIFRIGGDPIPSDYDDYSDIEMEEEIVEVEENKYISEEANKVLAVPPPPSADSTPWVYEKYETPTSTASTWGVPATGSAWTSWK